MKLTKRPNRLINEKSPYLLQHAYNPVDWYPWGDEAFEKAKIEGKPIFLSIGYSTCHWCHVMEKESFVDPEVADLLNEVFISIKVDREERPDLDRVYMAVCQKMTGSGGWPLTILMTPDKKPFFAETYLPKKSSFGRIGIMELAKKVKELWQNRREEVERSASENLSYLQAETPARSGLEIGIDTLEKAYQQLLELYDDRYGGFGYAPKFPTPHNLCFLMRYWKRTGNQQALDMVVKTLKAMRQGGIYDQLGYGFHRYSTDNRWFAPHFEKMLYDQALLAIAYLEAYQITGIDLFRRTASEIFDYTLTIMRDEKGGFYTAEDADSEGVEGKFYLWTFQEVKEVLSLQEMPLVAAYFNLEEKGNYQEGSSNLGKGVNILYIKEEISSIARKLNIDPKMAENLLQSARDKLYTAREKRIHPYKDDKILMDWNGLLIAALAKGGRILKEKRFIEAAEKAVEFFLTNMRSPQGFFFHRYRAGEAAVPAFLEDYAFFIWGLIELYESTFIPEYLTTALELNQLLLLHFLDKENGGFFQTSAQSEEVLIRNKEVFDGAIPSGNSITMLNLIRLARLTGNPSMEQEARRIAQTFAGTVLVSPAYYTQFLSAVDFAFGPSFELVIVGRKGSEGTEKMLETVENTFLPNKVVLFRPSDEENPEIIRINSFLKELTEIEGKTTAYVCRNYHCNLPTTDPDKMLELLQGERNGS